MQASIQKSKLQCLSHYFNNTIHIIYVFIIYSPISQLKSDQTLNSEVIYNYSSQ